MAGRGAVGGQDVLEPARRCEVVVSPGMWAVVREALLGSGRGSDVEQFAYLLGRANVPEQRIGAGGDFGGPVIVRLVCGLPLPSAALVEQSADRVVVAPEVTRVLLRTCYEHALSLVDVHSHPGVGAPPRWSAADLANAVETHRDFHATVPAAPPAFAVSLLVTRTGTAGVWLDPASGRLAPAELVVEGHGRRKQPDLRVEGEH